MKLLILTCNTGAGHNSTAAAISEYFTVHGVKCVTMDCLDFLPAAKAKLISEGHVLLYRKAPKLFGAGYRFEENHIPRYMRAQCDACADEFYEAVRQVGCDAVINVHVFPAMIMTAAIKQYHLSLPGYFVATDYTCSPGVSCADMDAYFIPHRELAEEFIRCGVPGDRLVPTGIPVRTCFCRSLPRAEARRRLDLPEHGRLVVLTCGSMGAGPMEELTQLLDQQMQPEDRLTVICGTNKKLLEKLQKDRLSDCVRLLGFTQDMDLYMDAADLLLTKAGGLTTSEALMKRLPLLYIDVIPGLETRNLEFMVSHGCALTAETPEALAALTCELLRDPDRLDGLRAKLAETFPDVAVERMYEFLCRDLGWEPESTT